jgi:hypothetical protein
VKLPAISDQTLIEELMVVVTAGWRLPDRARLRDSIRHLLYVTDPPVTELYYSTARRLLELLDETLTGAAEESFGNADTPLLSDEHSRTLRILFGVHVDYRWESVDTRREEAGAILLDKARGAVKSDTYHRRYEKDACRVVVECLRAHYGQETDGPRYSYSSVDRKVYAVVGPNQHFNSYRVNNIFRSNKDGLDFVRVWFHLQHPEAVTHIAIDSVQGAADYSLEDRGDGSYRLTFHLAEPTNLGQDIQWSYETVYEYKPDLPLNTEGRIGITGRNDGYTAGATVEFQCTPPRMIWAYSRRKGYFPIKEPSTSLMPDENNRVTLKETSETSLLRVYGLAWRW